MSPKDREYEALRREIERMIEMQHSLYNILYVGVAAVLAWGINNNNSLVCLLAYCIIFPAFYIMLSYNSGIIRIGAYIYVYYDEYFWEKRVHKLNTDEKYKRQRYVSSYKVPFIFASIMSTALSIILLYKNCLSSDIICIIIVSLSLLLLLLFCGYAFHQKNFDDLKRLYINAFEEMKKGENAQKSKEKQKK